MELEKAFHSTIGAFQADGLGTMPQPTNGNNTPVLLALLKCNNSACFFGIVPRVALRTYLMNFQPQLRKLRLVTRHALPKTMQMVLGFCALMIFQNAGAVLNDTGITQCGNATGYSTTLCVSSISGDQGTYPRQDAVVGRDAAAAPGNKGFSFTKIDDNGHVVNDQTVSLPGAQPTDWHCTLDNVTGLVWEVKTTAGLRSQSNTYSWYKSNATSTGGSLGVPDAGACFSAGRCDSEKYLQDVVLAGLCGSSPNGPASTQWRLPTVLELQSIVDFGSFNPAIDGQFFPNTPAGSNWWTDAPDSNSVGTSAWAISFVAGQASAINITSTTLYRVRLVRSGQ